MIATAEYNAFNCKVESAVVGLLLLSALFNRHSVWVDDFSENGPQNEDVLLTVSSDEPFEEEGANI